MTDDVTFRCNARGAYTRRTQMLRAPAVLILQIQRFAFMRKVKEEVVPKVSYHSSLPRPFPLFLLP